MGRIEAHGGSFGVSSRGLPALVRGGLARFKFASRIETDSVAQRC